MTTPTTFEYDVFISYNQNDKAWAAQLATRLEQEDWQDGKLKVFFAPWDIKPGESIPQRLEYALPRSRKVCFIMTPESAASEWVKVERYVTHHIDITERQSRLIPLYRRASEIPPFLQQINRIDFQNDAKFEDGYRILLATIKDEPLPRGAEVHASVRSQLSDLDDSNLRKRLQALHYLEKEQLIDQNMKQEFQRKLLDKWIDN